VLYLYRALCIDGEHTHSLTLTYAHKDYSLPGFYAISLCAKVSGKTLCSLKASTVSCSWSLSSIFNRYLLCVSCPPPPPSFLRFALFFCLGFFPHFHPVFFLRPFSPPPPLSFVRHAWLFVSFTDLTVVNSIKGDRGGTVVKVLCYKSEGHWFDPSWCHWIFH